MTLSRLAATLLLAFTFPVALISGPVTAAQNNSAASHVRITEVTETSHPFATLYCARQLVQVRFIGQWAEVVVDDESRTLRRAIAASGARYVASDDDTTVFWGKGPFATVTWSGQQLPLCAPSGAIIPPYRASGNEPFWAVTYDGWRATLKRPGEPDDARDAVISETSGQGQALVTGERKDAWHLEARDGLCIDDMSGMPHPQRTTLNYQSETLHGCGGDPERLLQGVVWRIVQGDQTPIGSTAAHIRFLADNEIVGSTGCNRFFGEYTLTGEGLSIKDIGSTRMACSSELMAQEDTLLKQLPLVNRFSFEDTDAQRLFLHIDATDVRLEAKAVGTNGV